MLNENDPLMANQNDWYLNQLGITQYVLRESSPMKAHLSIDISPEIKLVIVTGEQADKPIFDDILTALNLTKSQYLLVNPAQFIADESKMKALVWFINCKKPANWTSSFISTDSFDALISSHQLKKQLWSIFCDYEHYFNA